MLARHDEFGIADRPECPFHERDPVIAEKQCVVDEHARGAEAATPHKLNGVLPHPYRRFVGFLSLPEAVLRHPQVCRDVGQCLSIPDVQFAAEIGPVSSTVATDTGKNRMAAVLRSVTSCSRTSAR